MASIFTSITEFSVEQMLVFGVVFLSIYYLFRRQNRSVAGNGRKPPPCMTSLPIIGSVPFLPGSMEQLLEYCVSPKNKLGKIFSVRLGSKDILLLCGKKAIHDALITKAVDFADRADTFIASTLTNVNAKGIVSSHYNARFKVNRQLSLSILRQFGFGQRVMESRILTEVEEMINKIREEKGRPFNPKELSTSCVVNVVMLMLLGYRFDHTNQDFVKLKWGIHEAMATYSIFLDLFPTVRHIPYFKKMIKYYLSLSKTIRTTINSLLDRCLESETKEESFVNYFVEARGTEFDRDELTYIAEDLIVGGMETSATLIRWAIILLTNHVDIQERLHAEIDSVVGRERIPTLEDRANLPYVEATILEVMRYKTVLPFSLIHCTLKDTEVGGYFVPEKTTVIVNLHSNWQQCSEFGVNLLLQVIVNLHSVHMDPDDWENPEQFRPERFLDESGSVIGRDRVIPFSLGKRSCLGEQLGRQEAFLFIVSLLQNFDFKPPEGQVRISERGSLGVSYSPTDFNVRMFPRDA